MIREVDGIDGERVNILVDSYTGEVDRIGDEGVKILVNSFSMILLEFSLIYGLIVSDRLTLSLLQSSVSL